MTELDLLRKEVHATGFNISMMINLYKKRQFQRKSTIVLPDEVYCAVCREYLKDRIVRKDFPYFMIVLVKKAEEYCAKFNQDVDKFDKSFPEHISLIMKGD